MKHQYPKYKNKQIEKLPISKLKNYCLDWYILSSMRPGWAEAFIKRIGLRSATGAFRLKKSEFAPDDFEGQFAPGLCYFDEYIQQHFGFDPKTYLVFENYLPIPGNEQEKIKKECVKRFMELSDKLDAKTIIYTMQEFPHYNKFYCSQNLL